MQQGELINDLKAHVADGDVVVIVVGVSLSANGGNSLAGWTGPGCTGWSMGSCQNNLIRLS